jgi:hypothetical protein
MKDNLDFPQGRGAASSPVRAPGYTGAAKRPAAPPATASGRRIWKAPTSRTRWYWLAGSGVFFILILVWYIQARQTQQFPGPFNDPFRLFGIFAFILVFGTAAYTLRRRFARGLPGKVQNWLWMHTWVGITTILVALLHEDFIRITHDYCSNLSCLTETYWGTGALLALFLLVLSGVIGRLLDRWQTNVIAAEASSNGIGIMRALEDRILELEYTVERLCAGKSEPFKQFCLRLLASSVSQMPSRDPSLLPSIAQGERTDFQQAFATLEQRASLLQSLHRQQHATRIIRFWRGLHMVLATLSLLVITYHGIMELLVNVLHVLPAV